jgi:RecJ-like exonuclease
MFNLKKGKNMILTFDRLFDEVFDSKFQPMQVNHQQDYDGTTATASIENGLLTILLDKKEERKSKKVKIKF